MTTALSKFVPVLAALLLLAGCATHASRMEPFRAAWERADFDTADRLVDGLIADEAGEDASDVDERAARGSIDVEMGDTPLLLLEKAMTLLANGEPRAAVAVLRQARDELDEREAANLARWAQSAVTDDTALAYAGADYERVLIRVMLAIADLIAREGDAYAYALQVGEEQDQILDHPIDSRVDYNPREHYRRVAAGAYLEGVLLETRGARSEAAKVFERMLSYDPSLDIGQRALERTQKGRYVSEGTGVVHVFYFGGSGPYLEEGRSPATDLAMRLAQVIAVIATDSIVPIVQTGIPVPVLVTRDSGVEPLSLSIGGASANTSLLLDVNQVAAEQLDAMMPLIQARALVRRAVKAGVTTAGAKIAGDKNDEVDALAQMAGALVNLIWTATENADTRIWSTLPAEIQAARIEAPEGEHTLRLGTRIIDGPGMTGAPALMEARLRVRAGRESYVLVIQPDLGAPGAILIDRYSWPEGAKENAGSSAN